MGHFESLRQDIIPQCSFVVTMENKQEYLQAQFQLVLLHCDF